MSSTATFPDGRDLEDYWGHAGDAAQDLLDRTRLIFESVKNNLPKVGIVQRKWDGTIQSTYRSTFLFLDGNEIRCYEDKVDSLKSLNGALLSGSCLKLKVSNQSDKNAITLKFTDEEEKRIWESAINQRIEAMTSPSTSQHFDIMREGLLSLAATGNEITKLCGELVNEKRQKHDALKRLDLISTQLESEKAEKDKYFRQKKMLEDVLSEMREERTRLLGDIECTKVQNNDATKQMNDAFKTVDMISFELDNVKAENNRVVNELSQMRKEISRLRNENLDLQSTLKENLNEISMLQAEIVRTARASSDEPTKTESASDESIVEAQEPLLVRVEREKKKIEDEMRELNSAHSDRIFCIEAEVISSSDSIEQVDKDKALIIIKEMKDSLINEREYIVQWKESILEILQNMDKSGQSTRAQTEVAKLKEQVLQMELGNIGELVSLVLLLYRLQHDAPLSTASSNQDGTGQILQTKPRLQSPLSKSTKPKKPFR